MRCGWFFGIAAAGFIATGADAQSSPGFGASGSSVLGSCNDPSGTGPCHVQFDASTLQRFGGQGQSSTSNTVTYPNAYATISTSQGDLYLPDIHAAVSTSGNARILTQLVTYQTYQFNGATATPFALDLFYHFINSYQGGNADEYPGESFGQTFVSILLGNPFAAQGNNLAFPSIACGFNNSLIGWSAINGMNTSGENTVNGTLALGCDGSPIMLTPGEIFTVSTSSQFAANRGGFVDATNTFELTLSDSLSTEAQNYLRANLLAIAVPEPSSWALMLVGFGMIGFAARRRQMLSAQAA